MATVDLLEQRRRQAQRLSETQLDTLIVGGGILGAGIARDAAMRHWRVGLVEQYDLASGTSSRSSRLLHGGLRYLAQGRLGLVRQASREKQVLRRIAPHLAQPLPFLFPTYRGTCWPLWKLRLGVRLYDLLCGGQNFGPSSSFGPEELRRRLPGLNTHNLTGGVRYYDALTNDARLVLDTLRSAARCGAIICNYTRLESASRAATGWACQLRDVYAQQTYRLTARTVVNATGPWALQLPQNSIRLRLTKGVHLVVDQQRLPVAEAVVMAQEKRILFAIPWGQRVILGTTDTDYQGRVEAVVPEPADVDYLLSVTNATFPEARLETSHVLAAWAGLRPLLAARGDRPSNISRAHRIRMPQPGWLDVAGGKLTTYRLIAQQAVARLAEHLSRRHGGSQTSHEPLLPKSETEGISGLLPPPVSAELVEHFCQNEWAVHLDDVMRRRTSWNYYHGNADEIAREVAAWMAQRFGWNAQQQQAELAQNSYR